MGRRKVEAAPSPRERTNARRSSRLAVKERIVYDEETMYTTRMMLRDALLGKRKVSPRSTKKEKTKLTKGGAMAVRIVHEACSATTVASSMIDETPVSTRTRKQAPQRGRAAALATLDEDAYRGGSGFDRGGGSGGFRGAARGRGGEMTRGRGGYRGGYEGAGVYGAAPASDYGYDVGYGAAAGGGMNAYKESGVVMVYGLEPGRFNCDMLFNMLCQYGNVNKVLFMRSKPDTAMVEMGSSREVQTSIEHLYGTEIFGCRLELKPSKQGEVAYKEPFELPDGSPSFRDYSSSRNQRFSTPELIARNHIVKPTKSIHWYNAPPNMTEDRLKELFAERRAPVPQSVTIFQSRSEKSSSGVVDFESMSRANEALALANHTPVVSPGAKAPYIVKLAYAGTSSWVGPTAGGGDNGGGGGGAPPSSSHSVDPPLLPPASDCSFQSATVSLTESVQVTSSTSAFRERPVKPEQIRDKTVSPDEQQRRDDEDDDVMGVAALGGDAASFDDDAMVAPMDVTLLTEEELLSEKRRKRDTVAKQDTVAPKKDTVAKKSPLVKQIAANKKTHVTPSPPAARPAAPGRQARGPSVIMQRALYTDDLEITRRRDDAFADEFDSGPGEQDRSMQIASQLEAGTLAIEDLAPEDRILAELFSPVKSPRLHSALRNAVPLVLSSSSSSPAAEGGRKGRGGGGGRAARTNAAARLSDHFDNESDEDEYNRSPTGTVYPPDEMADIRSANRLKRSPYIRELFKASAASYSGDIEPQMETHQASRRRKIQYPGIAPIPEDAEEAEPAADSRLEQLDALYRVL